jgi:hypothetical protein
VKREAIVVAAFSVIAAIGARGLIGRANRGDEATPSPQPVCDWVPGDLHVGAAGASGSVSVGGFGPLSLAEVGDLASNRGLDYLDVVNPKPESIVTDSAFGSGDLSWLLGIELSFKEGDVLGLGPALSYSDPADSLRGMDQFARDIHRSGGVIQLTGVESSHWTPRFLDAVDPDVVEVWRGGPFSYATQGLHKDSAAAVGFYDDLLDSGVKAAMVGGSVTAQRALVDVAGAGEPTTWVCTTDASPLGIGAAIQEGRTTVSHEPPARKGPLVFLEGDQDGDGTFEEQMGGSVPPGTTVRVTVRGAPAARVRLIGSGSKLVKELIPDADEYTATFAAPKNTSWIRAELYLDESLSATKQRTCPFPHALEAKAGERVGYCGGLSPMLAMSSPIYVD